MLEKFMWECQTLKFKIITTIKRPTNIKYSTNFLRFQTNSYNVIIGYTSESHEHNLGGLIF